MTEKIPKNNRSIDILNKLISNRFYKGSIGLKKFELQRPNFPNNYRVYGILNDEKRFEIKAGFKPPVNIACKALSLIFFIVFIALLIKGDWIFSGIISILIVAFYTNYRIRTIKEKNTL